MNFMYDDLKNFIRKGFNMRNYPDVARMGIFGLSLPKLQKYGFPISKRMYYFYQEFKIHMVPKWIWNRSWESEVYLYIDENRVSEEKRNEIRNFLKKQANGRI
jgi:hypothetical protein